MKYVDDDGTELTLWQALTHPEVVQLFAVMGLAAILLVGMLVNRYYTGDEQIMSAGPATSLPSAPQTFYQPPQQDFFMR